jgi:hypothetical protein
LGPAPASWVIIGETSSIRLRPLTTGIGRGAYYVVNIPCIFLSSYMLNPDVRILPAPNIAINMLLTKRRRQTSVASAVTSGLEPVSSVSLLHTSSFLR